MMISLKHTDTAEERAEKAFRALNGQWNRHKLAEIFERYRELDRPPVEAIGKTLGPLDAG